MKQETNDVDKKVQSKMNYWKIAFLVLVGILLGTTVFLLHGCFNNVNLGSQKVQN